MVSHFSSESQSNVSPPSAEEVAATLAASRAVLAASQRTLEAGVKIQKDYDVFAAKHGIIPGCGAEALAGKNAVPARKKVFESLIFELENLDQRINEIRQEISRKKSKPVASARAVGHRYRI
jgi:hypothetical protein